MYFTETSYTLNILLTATATITIIIIILIIFIITIKLSVIYKTPSTYAYMILSVHELNITYIMNLNISN
jgi:hypothetical protein